MTEKGANITADSFNRGEVFVQSVRFSYCITDSMPCGTVFMHPARHKVRPCPVNESVRISIRMGLSCE
jgi:hypothetical protein